MKTLRALEIDKSFMAGYERPCHVLHACERQIVQF
jgi:hypothetical protein